MRTNFVLATIVLVVMLATAYIIGCSFEQPEDNEATYPPYDHGGTAEFKVPVPKGFDWEITQSWGEHCELCDEHYPPNPPQDPSYCESSHMNACCKYGWDFNLPWNADEGKPVLASGDGTVESVQTGDNGGWGNTVIVNHGDDTCTRYSHMLDDSITVSEGDYVCQGLILGGIGNTGGSSDGFHLHFQFEDCSTGEGIEMGFDDGNGVPTCTRGDDVYDSDGDYDFLILSNDMHEECGDDPFGDGELPEGGWLEAECGDLSGCPLIPNCGRISDHHFGDHAAMNERTGEAVTYLYSECAVDGKDDGKFYPFEHITRAEALKIPLFLFGLMRDCGDDEFFDDVDADDWFFEVVNCAVSKGLVDSSDDYLYPNERASFAEAAKFAVKSAANAGVIRIVDSDEEHFRYFPSSHWAYPYVETLYAYGAVTEELLDWGPDDYLLRQQFAIMVASLSPCFCPNIICESGCECSQEMMACIDPDDEEPGTGGGGNWSSVLEIMCYADEERLGCIDDEVELYTKCTITNNGDEVLRINDLVMYLTDSDDKDVCTVTDSHLISGVGTQNVDPGETRTPNGHYEILCSEIPDDDYLDVGFDLLEKVDGELTWYDEVLEASIEVKNEYFDECDDDDDDDDDDASDDDDAVSDDAIMLIGGYGLGIWYRTYASNGIILRNNVHEEVYPEILYKFELQPGEVRAKLWVTYFGTIMAYSDADFTLWKDNDAGYYPYFRSSGGTDMSFYTDQTTPRYSRKINIEK
jgi:peptidase M23-like protein/S-layer family protein